MSDCTILGDSIAVGVAQHRKDCSATAVVGVSSAGFNVVGLIDAPTVVISLGSNDGGDPTAPLLKLRRRIAGRVIWILPNKALQRERIVNIAGRFGDRIIDIPAISPDGIHPTPAGYRQLAERIAK